MAAFIEKKTAQFVDDYLRMDLQRDGNNKSVYRDLLDDSLETKPIFYDLLNNLLEKENEDIEFIERPGINYSLHGIHERQNGRPLL